jgi:hypothetical protein
MSELRKVKNVVPAIAFTCECGDRLTTTFLRGKPEKEEVGNDDDLDYTVAARCYRCRSHHQFNVNVLYNG